MPPFRPPARPPDRQAAAAALAQLAAGQRVSSSPKDLIRDAGGTRVAARLLGKSARTIQRRASGDGAGLSTSERRALARAGQAARTSRIIDQLGGAQKVAELTGRDISTVRRWANGTIRVPKADARQRLGRADVALRMKDKGVSVDPATGMVNKSTFLKLTGDVRVRGTTKSQSYATPGKNVGAWGNGVFIEPETMRAMIDALGRGDYVGAHQVIEEYLSTNYAACGGYNPAADVGFFIDRIDSMSFNQDAD